ncbi:MAG: hypothetical protein M3N91_10455 [Pseudomonadota bacterium]|nr:hypothetical protein [Pseudomonadota bacterium]
MTHVGSELLGWSATAVFVASYFIHPTRMRTAQMLGALLWLAYGVSISSWPVIVANLLVFSAAAWTTFRKAPAAGPGQS